MISHSHLRNSVLSLILLGAVMALTGCGSTNGDKEQAPPAGGPQQNSHVPPGEAAANAPAH